MFLLDDVVSLWFVATHSNVDRWRVAGVAVAMVVTLTAVVNLGALFFKQRIS